MYDLLARFWDPICGEFGREERRANREPLTRSEALAYLDELRPCVDPDYRGQGQALLSIRYKFVTG